MMLRRVVCNGYFWLVVAGVALFVRHGFRPFDSVTLWPDSYDYMTMADMDLLDPKGLATLRPWGYPVILKLYKVVFQEIGPKHSWWVVLGEQDSQWLDEHQARQLVPGCWLVFEEIHEPWAYLPTCHLLVHIFAVLMFYAGLRQLNFPAAAGVLMCLPVIIFDYLDLAMYSLLADATGQAFLLLTVSSFFFVLRQPARPARWACLALCVLVSYHIRAAFQFLLVMLPLLTAILGSYATRKEGVAPGSASKHRLVMTGVMLAICWLPYLAYCGWRSHVVGQFSLLSCTGFQFFGLCGQLFTDEMLPEVRPECRPLAEEIIRGRQDSSRQAVLREWTGRMWFRQSHGWIPPLGHGRPVYELDYDRIQDQYVWLVWQVMWPWANQHYQGDTVQIDRDLLTFSLDFIGHHPDIYAMCVVKGWRAALVHAVLRLATLVPLMLFGAMLLLAVVVRVCAGPAPVAQIEPMPAGLSARERFKVLTWTVMAFFVFKVQLAAMVVAIMMPWDTDGRYVDTASVLLPCLPMLGIYVLGRYLVRTLRSRNLVDKSRLLAAGTQGKGEQASGPEAAGLPS
jgi:hypothetical protein